VILDDSDQAGALGYHDLTSDGLPIGKVFAASDLKAGTSWTVTASHELLEMSPLGPARAGPFLHVLQGCGVAFKAKRQKSECRSENWVTS